MKTNVTFTSMGSKAAQDRERERRDQKATLSEISKRMKKTYLNSESLACELEKLQDIKIFQQGTIH
ncbi:hypothetical protein HPP92_021708 [Vanilla planifolia]|uniref:Uncharacterized protein n=1 Tax=Vanilla planifolia TaxID=51239 RepID=A0A835Q5E9_VANPL|nr:hypothetical protein HPP92_021708 [Vanilla planifolia]